MSQNRWIAIAIAAIVAATLTLEIVASARDLPHDGVQPDTTSTAPATP
jgi:hypothetical protein